MNNKGQTLVIFIIILPIIIGFCAFVIDIGLVTYENTKLKNTTESILKSVARKDDITTKNIKK